MQYSSDEGPVMHWGGAAILRNAYYKPVVYDEVAMTLPARWGRYSGEEMTYLMWMGAIGGHVSPMVRFFHVQGCKGYDLLGQGWDL